ncbi:MAG: hypothetical protein NT166_04590 [Candidatus Aminicenantes bacterium]|nr:hypothetical protein [Candidatus Aminicenantes bacterium]
MTTDQKKAILRLPLIGRFERIDILDTVGKIVELDSHDKEVHKVLQNFELALGDYLLDSGEYQKILDLLFPNLEKADVKELFNWSISDFPLFLWGFAKSSSESNFPGNKKNEKERLSSGWSALMLELGEFKLDEQFKELKNEINYLMQYFCGKRNEYSVLYAMFEDNMEIINKIWERILGDDICLIFIDDEVDFDKRWGIGHVNKIERDKSDFKKFKTSPTENNKIWINPVLKDKDEKVKFGYNRDLTRDKVIEIINQKCAEKTGGKLPVLIIDLLYLDEECINKIEGDNLIRDLRKEFPGGHEREMTPLIVGFTGGKSPFVINSAVKAGADIVIMKERGETIEIPNAHGSGNPGGLFDLLWALSQNISRWRFLEKYKKFAENEFKTDKHFYRPVLERLFLSIENESPFWRKYLSDWQRDIENLRLQAILKSNSHE